MRILVADADADRRSRLAEWLAEPPADAPDVITAAAAGDVEQLLNDETFDLIVTVDDGRDAQRLLQPLERAVGRSPLLLLRAARPAELPVRPWDDVLALDDLTPPLLVRSALRLAERWKLEQALTTERAARIRAEEALAQSTRQASEAERAHSEWISTTAHDLRSPLNAVIGYSELMHEELEDRGQDDLLSDIRKITDVSRKLLGIVSGFSEAARTDSKNGEDSTGAEAEALNALFNRSGGADADLEHEEGTILIIDDDDDLRELMARFLQSEGFAVETASNGEEGLRLARTLKPSVITLDVRMPGIDGWDVLKTLKSDPALKETPVIMLTGRGNERIAARALRQGVDDYLIKGDISALGLRRAVEGVMEKATLKRAVEEAQRSLIRANETLEVRVDQQTEQIRSLASSLTLAEQEERHRIARILHDNLQQHLTALIIRVKLLSQKPPEEAAPILKEQLEDVTRLLKEALQMTRTLTVELSPPVMQDTSITTTLEWLAHYIEDLHGLSVEVEAENAHEVPRKEMRLLLFQLVRELLFNVVKHADVDTALVKIEQDDGHLHIHVIDEGTGFDPETSSPTKRTLGGWGLNTMGERLSLFKGRLDIDSAPGRGTRTVISVPCSMLAASPDASAYAE